MGKRELLIIVAFVLVGAVAYQITAPPAKEGEGFSFSRLWRNTRRTVRGNAPIATHVFTGTIPVGRAVKQVRISGLNRGITVVGEARQDIGYELTVGSSGPDEATALAWAKETEIQRDEIEDALGLRVRYPEQGSQYGSITLRVPARLGVRVDGSVGSMQSAGGGARLTGVGSVELDATGGIAAEAVTGAVTGSHGGGELAIAGAASVNLRLDASRARLTSVTGGLTLTGRQARVEITESGGAADVSGNGGSTVVRNHRGTVRVTGSNTRVTIDRPHGETRVDVRRSDVQVTVGDAVPMTLLTSDNPLRVLLAETPAIAIDAVATEPGRITATDFALTPVSSGGEERLDHTFGRGAPARVTIRNLRGHVVIAQVK